jgi:hypothetical protein
VLLAIYQVKTKLIFFFFLLNIYVVCTTCTTTDHGRAGHDFVSLNDAGND